jgi:acyl-CoA thioester hydrolase
MGVVYYANFLVWFEVARTDWLRQAGWTYRDMEAKGFLLPVLEVHCTYRRPALYDDEIELTTRGSLLSSVRVRFDYEVARVADRVTLAGGYTVHASLDRGGRPCRLPSEIQHLFAAAAAEPHAAPGSPSVVAKPAYRAGMDRTR